MRGNLADLAATGLASEPTLRNWIKGQPDQDWIIRRGDRGVDYEIDIPKAIAAWQAAEDEKTEAARQRADDLKQLGLDLGLGETSRVASGFSIAERTALLQEELVAIKLDEKRGMLIPFDEVEGAIGDVLARFRQKGDTFAARLAKRIDLTRDQITAIDRLMRADQDELADMMENWRPGGGDDGSTAAPAVEDPSVPNGD
jgi:hypothetical protein